MGRLCAVLALVAGCYRPTIVTGAPCDDTQQCPTGLTCVAGSCELRMAGDAGGPDGAAADAGPNSDGAPIDTPTGTPWGAPVKLMGVATLLIESDPTITTDRLTLMFVRGNDLFIATRGAAMDAFSSVQAVTALNTTADERSPELSASGTTVYFTSDRDGGDAVYVSELEGGAWKQPTLVTELSIAGVNDVAVSPDGLTSLVAAGASGNRLIYRASRTAIGDAFSAPVLEPMLNTLSNRAAPTLTNGGDVVYLHAASVRDLYVAHRLGNGYAMPMPVTELNTAQRDASPFVLQSDDYMVFERNGDLFESVR